MDKVRPASAKPLDGLVTLAASGDRTAQNQLLAELWPLIAAVVRARLSEAVRAIGAEDITQEAAMRMLQRLPTYRGLDDGAFAAWVRAIAESALLDALRRDRAVKRGRRNTGPLDMDLAAPREHSEESVVQDRRRYEELRACMLAMDEEARAPVVLQQLGYSYAEIAEILGCTPEAARKRATRLTEKLRLAFANDVS